MIEAELQKSVEKYPFIEKEIARLALRKRILEYAKPGGVGAEVGVFRGHFAEVLIEKLTPTKIYLIDPWTKLGEYFNWKGGAKPYTNFDQLPTRVAKREAELRTARFPDVTVKILEGYFLEEMHKIEEKLDWIYIDGNHGYKQVLADLNAAQTLLKPDGVIIGDDWRPNPEAKHHGVFRAVQEFTRATNYQIVSAGYAGQYCLMPAPSYPPEAAEWQPKAARQFKKGQSAKASDQA